MEFIFFFNDTATTEIYTLSLHDALPISTRPTWLSKHVRTPGDAVPSSARIPFATAVSAVVAGDRKSTRLNSSHGYISYAVFCLKKKYQFLLIFLGSATGGCSLSWRAYD